MKTLYRTLILLGIGIFALAMSLLIENTVNATRADAVKERAISLFPHAEAEEMTISRDFQQLYAENPDIVGWLQAGESIEYPVVQSDNSYYLTHNFFRESDSNGALFLNADNVLIPRDNMLLIHGHNMKSGAMFGTLCQYESYEYLREHPIITFRTIYDDENVYYTPVFAFHASMDASNPEYFHITRFVFDTEEAEAFFSEISALSVWDAKTDVNADDSLLTLITCSYQQEDGRFMLVCRRLRENETASEIKVCYNES